MVTPYDANSQLKKNRSESVPQLEYAQIIGSLMHLMNHKRPDIAYKVCRLSRYTHSPNHDHWNALVRLLRYLKGTKNYGIFYSGFLNLLEFIVILTGCLIQMRPNSQVVIASTLVEVSYHGSLTNKLLLLDLQ